MSESKNEKLRPVEVSVYRRVFLSRIEHGASVEAADRQGLQACKIWERRGAFNDDESPSPVRADETPSPHPTAGITTWRDEWRALGEWLRRSYGKSRLAGVEIGRLVIETERGERSFLEFWKTLNDSIQ